MRKFQDLKGTRFGRWVVLERAESKRDKSTRGMRWHARCDCGTITVVNARDLRNGLKWAGVTC